MKKAICMILATAAALTCLASCQKKIYTDPEEYSSYIEQSQKEASISESKQDIDISNAKVKTKDKIGKTEEGKQFVIKRVAGNYEEYRVYYFNNEGKTDYYIRYVYCNDKNKYESMKETEPLGGEEIIDTDDQLRCITYKGTDLGRTYDTLVAQYSDSDVYTIVK